MPQNFPIFRKTFIYVILLFLLTIPIFYILIFYEKQGKYILYLYIIFRFFRFILLVVLGCLIRNKNKNVILFHKKITVFFLGCIFISIWLHLENITIKLYFTISHLIGIYSQGTPLFLAVLGEQLLSGDLYWGTLLCLTIVFFNLSPQYKQTYPQ